jgi:hypothetical protein
MARPKGSKDKAPRKPREPKPVKAKNVPKTILALVPTRSTKAPGTGGKSHKVTVPILADTEDPSIALGLPLKPSVIKRQGGKPHVDPSDKKAVKESQTKATQTIAQVFKRPTGAPRMEYDVEVGDFICECLVQGMSLRRIVDIEGVPSVGVILDWVWREESFGKRYRAARKVQAEHEALALQDLADEKPWTYVDQGGQEHIDPAWVSWQKLRIDARRWNAAKLLPAVYGDNMRIDGKIDHAHSVDPLDAQRIQDLKRQLAGDRGPILIEAEVVDA